MLAVMRDSEHESPPPSLRGRLAEVFFPALVGETLDPLLRRLGDLASVDEPICGASTGLAALQPHLARLAAWFSDHTTRYQKSGAVAGADRDVAEGVLDLRVDGVQLAIPVGVVAQRGKNRSVELRVYHASHTVGVERRGPAPAIAADHEVPRAAADVLRALRDKDEGALRDALQADGTVCDAAGREYGRGALAELFASRILAFDARAVADNGRICAIEAVRPSGRAGLVVIQRGDGGLVRSLRVYDEE